MSIVNYKIIYKLYFVQNQTSFHLEILHTTNMDQALFYQMQFCAEETPEYFLQGTLLFTLNSNDAEPRLIFRPHMLNTCRLSQS